MLGLTLNHVSEKGHRTQSFTECGILTHFPLAKIAGISQMPHSNAFSWMETFVFWFEFHWSLFLRVQLTLSHHWFRLWLGAKQVITWSNSIRVSLAHICGTRGRWFNMIIAVRNLLYEWSCRASAKIWEFTSICSILVITHPNQLTALIEPWHVLVYVKTFVNNAS